MDLCRFLRRWQQAGGRIGIWSARQSDYFDQFWRDLDYQFRKLPAGSDLELGGLVGGWSQNGGHGRLSLLCRPHLYHANHTVAGLESVGGGQCHFLDHSVAGFHLAAKSRFNELGGPDEPAGAQSDEFGESSSAASAGRPKFLPAHALKQPIGGRKPQDLASVSCADGGSVRID